MEPVQTKRCLVLLVVFALGLGISLSCAPQEGEKPAAAQPIVAKKDSPPSAPSEKKAEKSPQKLLELPMAAESKAQTEGVEPQNMPDPAAIEIDEIPRDETPQETAKRLGPPLVEQPDKLVRLDEADSIWLDKPGGRLVMVGEVCQREAALEMFVCLWHTKEHESVLTTRVPAYKAHAGLLALGAKVGNPVQFMPKYVPAGGTLIDIDVIWKDKDGKIQKKRAQEWIRNYSTKKPMQLDWVFAGSGFWTDESTGKKYYQAESGDFICVSNFSTAMLDLPVKSTQQNEGLMFEALTKNIPPLGTPVTIVLKPRLGNNKN